MGSDDLYKGGVEVSDGKFLLKVSKDKLEAAIVAKDPKETTLQGLDLKALMAEVRNFGVSFGLQEQPLPKGDGSYCVAKGVGAVHGENAKIKSYVKPAVVRAPKVKDPTKDKVDYRELGTIVNVPKDKLLLEKIPLTVGSPGKTVTSEVVNPKPGKDIKIKVGSGVVLSEDGMRVVSEVEGKYMLADGKASVVVEHIMSGDVDMSTGNIAFVGGRLVINGAILPGFKVKGKGEVYIAQGVQNSAEVTAGGDLEIKGGVIGEDVVLKCWGNIKVDFIENVGRIEAKGDLLVTDAMIQGHARVGNNLSVLSGKGALVGGKYIIGGSLYVKELGSDAEVVTEVSVGINPQLEEKKKKFEQEKEIWPDKMNEIIKTTTGLKKLKEEAGGTLPPEKAELLKKYNEMLPQVMDKVSELTEMEKELEEEIDQTVNESVYVYGHLYPGTTVTIGGMSRTIVSEEEGVVAHFDKSSRQIHCRAMTPQERQAASS